MLVGCRGNTRPNVLLITVDTLRADHLGCYGFKLARTPNIDRLAREGVLCRQARCAAPITMPSHTTIMTGLYPPAHSVRDNGLYALPEEADTLAERFNRAGYETYAVVSAIVLSRRYRLDQGFDAYDDDLWSEDAPRLFMIRDRPAARTADRFLAWHRRRSDSGDRQPFFAWIHFFDPHQPYAPPTIDRLLAPSPYDAEIASVDRALGRILDRLRETGEIDRTLIVFTADHGESLGEHGEKTHGIFVYDATTRVPLIFRFPPLFPAARVYEAPIHSADIAPTVLRAASLRGGRPMQGLDLLDALRGRVPAPPRSQYAESRLSELGFGMAPLYAVTADGYKWIRAPRPELYDLTRDPRERTNIYTQQMDRAGRMDAELQRLLDNSQSLALKKIDNPLPMESDENLHALGYLAAAGEREAMGGMDPKDGMVLYAKMEDARHLCQQGKWSEAEAPLRAILDATPRNLTAINIMGLTSLKQGRLEEAVGFYTKSLVVEPSQFRVEDVLGNIHLLQGRTNAAERCLLNALKLAPKHAEAMNSLGFIRSLAGDDRGAQEWYEKSIAADPTFPRVYRRLGDLYYERADFVRAAHYYARAIEAIPGDFQAMVQAASSARRLGDTAGAGRYLTRAREVRPDSWIPCYNLACLNAVAGRPEQAVGFLREAVDRGLRRMAVLDQDPDLATLRQRADFQAIVARVKIIRAEQQEPADADESDVSGADS